MRTDVQPEGAFTRVQCHGARFDFNIIRPELRDGSVDDLSLVLLLDNECLHSSSHCAAV